MVSHCREYLDIRELLFHLIGNDSCEIGIVILGLCPNIMSCIVSSPNNSVNLLFRYLFYEQIEGMERKITVSFVRTPVARQFSVIFRDDSWSTADRLSAFDRITCRIKEIRMEIRDMHDIQSFP